MKDFAEKLVDVYAKRSGEDGTALFDMLSDAGIEKLLSASYKNGRCDCSAVLNACLPTMQMLCGEARTFTLEDVHEYMVGKLFPIASDVQNRADISRAIELCIAAMACVIRSERAPFDVFTDFSLLTSEELSKSDAALEYRSLTDNWRTQCIDVLMRISRELGPYDILSHICAVHHIALSVARRANAAGIAVDSALVSAAAMSHDAGKFGCRGEEAKRTPFYHYYYTVKWLTSMGLKKTARIAGNHAAWELLIQNIPIESYILIYADFRARGMRDGHGNEHTSIYTLSAAYDIVFSKLINLTPEKADRYRRVYKRLSDFEAFLSMRGVNVSAYDDTPLSASETPQSIPKDEKEFRHAVRVLCADKSMELMRMLKSGSLFKRISELLCTDESVAFELMRAYIPYMTANERLAALETVLSSMEDEGSAQLSCAREIADIILDNYDPHYGKELPPHAEADAVLPSLYVTLDDIDAVRRSAVYRLSSLQSAPRKEQSAAQQQKASALPINALIRHNSLTALYTLCADKEKSIEEKYAALNSVRADAYALLREVGASELDLLDTVNALFAAYWVIVSFEIGSGM